MHEVTAGLCGPTSVFGFGARDLLFCAGSFALAGGKPIGRSLSWRLSDGRGSMFRGQPDATTLIGRAVLRCVAQRARRSRSEGIQRLQAKLSLLGCAEGSLRRWGSQTAAQHSCRPGCSANLSGKMPRCVRGPSPSQRCAGCCSRLTAKTRLRKKVLESPRRRAGGMMPRLLSRVDPLCPLSAVFF